MKELEAIKARAEAATEGPWMWAGTAARHELSGETGPVLACASLLYPDQRNAEFIAHARTDIPKLIAAIEAVEALRTEWFRELESPEHMVPLEDVIDALDAAITEALR